MSLVSEALRKARRSAAEEEARQRGRLYRSTIPLTPRRHGGGSKLLVGAAVGVAVGLSAAVVVWLVLGRGPAGFERQSAAGGPITTESRPIPQEAVRLEPLEGVSEDGRAPSAAVAAAAGNLPDPPAIAASKPPSEAVAETQSAAEAGQIDAPAEAALATPPATETAIEDSPPAGSQTTTPPAPALIGPSGERVFMIDADLGRVSLNLGFIVFRSIDPFAEINGIEVRKGSIIEGFTVERIEADRVVLRDADGTLVLRVP